MRVESQANLRSQHDAWSKRFVLGEQAPLKTNLQSKKLHAAAEAGRCCRHFGPVLVSPAAGFQWLVCCGSNMDPLGIQSYLLRYGEQGDTVM